MYKRQVSGFSCFEMKRCLEGQEPAEEIRNVVQEQIRRILALGAEEGLISGGFSEEYQTMCFLGAVGSYLAVSYTHLDVYKRQLLTISTAFLH